MAGELEASLWDGLDQDWITDAAAPPDDFAAEGSSGMDGLFGLDGGSGGGGGDGWGRELDGRGSGGDAGFDRDAFAGATGTVVVRGGSGSDRRNGAPHSGGSPRGADGGPVGSEHVVLKDLFAASSLEQLFQAPKPRKPLAERGLFSDRHDTWMRGHLNGLISALDGDHAADQHRDLAAEAADGAARPPPHAALPPKTPHRVATKAHKFEWPDPNMLRSSSRRLPEADLVVPSDSRPLALAPRAVEEYPDHIDFVDDPDGSGGVIPSASEHRRTDKQSLRRADSAQKPGEMQDSPHMLLAQHSNIFLDTATPAPQRMRNQLFRSSTAGHVDNGASSSPFTATPSGMPKQTRDQRLDTTQSRTVAPAAAVAEPLALAALRTLREVDASYNMIDSLGSLLSLPNIGILRLQHNQIEEVDMQSLHHTSRLHTLDLSYNRIRKLKYLQRLVNLQDLNLEFNHLRSLSLSRSMPKLRTLNLGQNRLVAFSGAQFPGLTTLNLDGNCISEIEEPEGLCSLEVLSIENQRTDDQTIVLAGMESLRELRVAGNIVGSTGALAGWFIESLDCRGAQLREIPSSLVQRSSTLWRLCLSHNLIVDPYPLAEIRSLVELDLSFNQISEIGRVMLMLRRLSALRMLDLRGNPITEQLSVSGSRHDDTLRATDTSMDIDPPSSAQAVREICYRSAIISCVGPSLEVLDLVPLTQDDRSHAKQRMYMLKDMSRLIDHARFPGWTVQSVPLDDVTVDDQVYVEMMSGSAAQQHAH
nr:hypothetical protein HK105_001832 [Polyrhizophydium stewartii]